jgi:hypothetical protein
MFAVDPKPAPIQGHGVYLDRHGDQNGHDLRYCGHAFDPNGRRRDLSDPDWLPVAALQ